MKKRLRNRGAVFFCVTGACLKHKENVIRSDVVQPGTINLVIKRGSSRPDNGAKHEDHL